MPSSSFLSLILILNFPPFSQFFFYISTMISSFIRNLSLTLPAMFAIWRFVKFRESKQKKILKICDWRCSEGFSKVRDKLDIFFI